MEHGTRATRTFHGKLPSVDIDPVKIFSIAMCQIGAPRLVAEGMNSVVKQNIKQLNRKVPLYTEACYRTRLRNRKASANPTI